MRILPDGGYAIVDEVDIAGEGVTHFVFGRGWLIEIVDVAGGDYFFISDGREVRPTSGRFGVFYPPFSLIRCSVRDFTGRVRGIGSERPQSELPATAFTFESDLDGEFESVRHGLDVLKTCRNRRSIEVNTQPSLVSIRAKRLIDENFLIYPSIARIAARIGVTHEHLSRQFKKDLGLAPSAYLHQLRVAEATFRLSMGEEIIDISQEVGYNDLSRFYKQFRKATRTSPAQCRLMFDR